MLFETLEDGHKALQRDWRWPHFTIAELSCRCGGRYCGGAYWHDPSFLDALEALRACRQQPLLINSAHRCPEWNRQVGGAPQSRHLTIAVDIALAGHDRHLLLRDAKSLGFTGLGLGVSFLHLDRRARPALWYYKGSRPLWQT